MNRFRYASLWLLLATALCVVVCISFMDEIKIGDYSVPRASFKEHLLGEAGVGADSLRDGEGTPLDSLMEGVELMEEELLAETDTLPQSLFIFGDSMTYNLALRFSQYAKQNGHTIHSVNWDSSNTKIWAESDTLRHFINLYHPTQIFISLGSNELYLKNPDSRVKYVKRIIEMIDTIPFVWIGPPNWKEDSGINDMLERECGKKRFFRSAGMTFERKKDKIHPTRGASAMWIDSIARWMPKSAHPIIMETPADSIKKCNPNMVLLKALNK